MLLRGLSPQPTLLSIAMKSRVKGLLAVSAPRPPAGDGAEAEPGAPRLAAAAASRWPMALSTNGDGSVNVPPSSPGEPGEGGGIIVSSPGEGCGVNAVLLCRVHEMPKRSSGMGLDAVTVDAA